MHLVLRPCTVSNSSRLCSRHEFVLGPRRSLRGNLIHPMHVSQSSVPNDIRICSYKLQRLASVPKSILQCCVLGSLAKKSCSYAMAMPVLHSWSVRAWQLSGKPQSLHDNNLFDQTDRPCAECFHYSGIQLAIRLLSFDLKKTVDAYSY